MYVQRKVNLASLIEGENKGGTVELFYKCNFRSGYRTAQGLAEKLSINKLYGGEYERTF